MPNDEPTIPERETTLESLREALAASQTAMRILQKADDFPGSIKAARAVSDISARISRLEGPGAGEIPTTSQRREVIREIISVIEEDPTHALAVFKEELGH